MEIEDIIHLDSVDKIELSYEISTTNQSGKPKVTPSSSTDLLFFPSMIDKNFLISKDVSVIERT